MATTTTASLPIADWYTQHKRPLPDNRSWPIVPGRAPSPSHRSRVLEIARRRATPTTPGEEHVVVALFANVGAIGFLKNLLCSLGRLHVERWMTVAFDAKVCPALASGGFDATACAFPYDGAIGGSQAHNGTEGMTKYRTLDFNTLVFHRVAWMFFLLRQGLSVLHCDADVVWLKDPLTYLSALPEHDILVQSEQSFGNNGGFYLARASVRTCDAFRWWLEDLRNRWNVGQKKFEEQHSLNDMLRNGRKHRRGMNISALKLPDASFPNGRIWWLGGNMSTKRAAYVVHCNWVKTTKKARLVRDNLWFLADDDASCRAGFDPLEAGCDRRCVPVSTQASARCSLGRRCAPCAGIGGCCDRLAARIGRSKSWHPMAYRLANCSHVPLVQYEERRRPPPPPAIK